MSSYRARRNDEEDFDDSVSESISQEERNNKNNQENVKKAADIAAQAPVAPVKAAGVAVKAGDKITGGKVSKTLGNALTKATKALPRGQKIQNQLNKLNESGVSDVLVGVVRHMPAPSTGASSTTKGNNSQKTPTDNKNSSKTGPGNNNNLDGDTKINIPKKKLIIAGLCLSGGIILIAFLIAIINVVVIGPFADAFGANKVTEEDMKDIDFDVPDEEAQAFYQRIAEVKMELEQTNQDVETTKIIAVYTVASNYNHLITYKTMTKPVIKYIAQLIANCNHYDEKELAKTLTDQVYAYLFPSYSKTKRKRLAKETIEYINIYDEMSDSESSFCAKEGSCNYSIKGVTKLNGVTYTNKNISASNIKVRLMNCHDRGWGRPIPNEQLIDFEDYITGVVYAEIGGANNLEAYRAQAVAARSYALTRPTTMRNAAGLKLYKEKGQWILQIRNCTEDQVFCNPDKGCSIIDPGKTVYSGRINAPANYKPPLPKNSKIRVAVSSVMGEVLVDANKNVIHTSYNNQSQNRWKALANNNYNYREILLQYYRPVASNIEKNTCNSNASLACKNGQSGPYANWKQRDSSWANIMIANDTIGHVGCLATSIAILIAKSGTSTIVQGDFNPGSFVIAMKSKGGFDSSCNLNFYAVSKVAPNFKYRGSRNILNMSKQSKLNEITNLLNKGYYVTAEVMGNTGQHWVAIDSVKDNQIYMMDPDSNGTNLWNTYSWRNTSNLRYFSVS